MPDDTEERYEVTIYFKSGNKLVANFIEFETSTNGLGELVEVRHTNPAGFGMQYINVDQIECVTARPLGASDAR